MAMPADGLRKGAVKKMATRVGFYTKKIDVDRVDNNDGTVNLPIQETRFLRLAAHYPKVLSLR